MNRPRRILACALLAALLGGCCSLHVQDRLLAKPAYRVAVKFAPNVRWQRLVSEGMVDVGGGAERRKWQKKGVRQANKLREYVGARLLRQLQNEWRWVTRDPELDIVMEIDEFVLWKKSFDLSKFVQGLFFVPVPGAAFVLGFPVTGGQLRGTLLVQDCDGGMLHRVPLESIYNDQPKLGAQRIAEEIAAVVRENGARLDECRGGGRAYALHRQPRS